MRLRVLSKVDLPQPEGPMKAVTSLGAMFMFTVFQRLEVAVVQVQVFDRYLIHKRNHPFLSSSRGGRCVYLWKATPHGHSFFLCFGEFLSHKGGQGIDAHHQNQQDDGCGIGGLAGQALV